MTRQAQKALSAMTVKTDRNDARGLAHLLRMGWFRPMMLTYHPRYIRMARRGAVTRQDVEFSRAAIRAASCAACWRATSSSSAAAAARNSRRARSARSSASSAAALSFPGGQASGAASARAASASSCRLSGQPAPSVPSETKNSHPGLSMNRTSRSPTPSNAKRSCRTRRKLAGWRPRHGRRCSQCWNAPPRTATARFRAFRPNPGRRSHEPTNHTGRRGWRCTRRSRTALPGDGACDTPHAPPASGRGSRPAQGVEALSPVRHGQHQAPARPQEPLAVGQEPDWIRQVLDDVGGDDPVVVAAGAQQLAQRPAVGYEIHLLDRAGVDPRVVAVLRPDFGRRRVVEDLHAEAFGLRRDGVAQRADLEAGTVIVEHRAEQHDPVRRIAGPGSGGPGHILLRTGRRELACIYALVGHSAQFQPTSLGAKARILDRCGVRRTLLAQSSSGNQGRAGGFPQPRPCTHRRPRAAVAQSGQPRISVGVAG